MNDRLVAALTLWALACSGGVLAEGPAESDLRVTKHAEAIGIARGDAPYCAYRFHQVPFKPYLETLHTPRGVNILRDAPQDHLHHHALMFALGADGVDFWAEHPDRQPGRQVDRGLETTVRTLPQGRSAAVLLQRLDWLEGDSAQQPLLRETRTIQAYAGPELNASLLGWQTELAPAVGKESVVLNGSHYFGLGMRFVTEMDRNGQFTFATGKPGEVIRGEERVTHTKWVAYHSDAGDGQLVTVALFDHPRNPRHPAAMFTMSKPFAYMSATLELFRQPLTLTAARPLVVRYGVALWDGEIEREAIESLYATWLEIEAAAHEPK
jgi:hypothetical protein